MRLYLLFLLANLSFLNATTNFPTFFPTVVPTFSQAPTVSSAPSDAPTVRPTKLPTVKPTRIPTQLPTAEPSTGPTRTPSVGPTIKPTVKPTVVPTIKPTVVPTIHPTIEPSHHPTIYGPGWLLESYHLNETMPAMVVYGSRTQTCFSFFSGEGEVYYKLSCGDEYIQFQIYDDAECTNAIHQGDVDVNFEDDRAYFGIDYTWTGYHYSYLGDVGYVQIQCTTDGAQYDVLQYTEDIKFAVTEFYQEDNTVPEDDQFYQCHNDCTQFAAYQKGHCFDVERGTYFNEVYTFKSNYMKFSTVDSTYISLAYYSDETCTSYATDLTDDTFGEEKYTLANIFTVDDCKMNGFQGYYYRDSSVSDMSPADLEHAATTPLAKAAPKKRSTKEAHTTTFSYDKTTPTMVRQAMIESLAKAQNKEVVPLPVAMNAKIAAKKAAAKTSESADKVDQGIREGWDDARDQRADIYFTDDQSFGSIFYNGDDDDFEAWDDDEYYNDFGVPGPPKFHALSEFYLWKNEPATTLTQDPAQWLTEVIYDSEEVPLVAQTRATRTCIPYTLYSRVWFNYQVVCENDLVHVLYYGYFDINCEQDYRINTWQKDEFFHADDASFIGRNKYFWDYSYAEVYCTDVMFSAQFNAVIEDNSFATEFFYPVLSFDDDNYEYSSNCTTNAEDVILGVAIREDFCFNLNVYYIDTADAEQVRTMSVQYWVDEEDNNQNIQFGVWESPECKDKFIHQTKEIEINTCYAHQPNWWYNDELFEDAHKKASLTADEKLILEAKNHAVAKFSQHETMGTPFSRKLMENAPKTVIANSKRAHAKKSRSTKKGSSTSSAAGKKAADLFQGYYYYYNDDANTILNNRDSAMKNQWFTIPTTPTIPPSEVPTVSPSEAPSVHPSELPTIAPSQPPTEIPTIEPTMQPNPPTLRPTPAAGMPTASPTHQVTYTFQVIQTLNGISADTFNGDNHNRLAFKEAVAMGIPPLTSDNIDWVGVADAVVESRKLRGLLEDGEAVDITYDITYTVAETGYNDAETAYHALVSSLNTAIVETDLFEGYISVVAAEDAENAPDLLDTTSSEMEVSDASQVGTDDDSKPNTKTHSKTVVGVLLGLGGGLLIIGVIWCCIFGPLSTRRNEESA